MAEVIQTRDGKHHILFSFQDLCELLDAYAGEEVTQWVVNYIEEAIENAKEEHSERL